jgi:cysteinyl-tRNA synthetase
MADILYRSLKTEGYNPRWVMNLTDVDDKTIKGTLEKYGKGAGIKELFEFTETYRQTFIEDLKELNILAEEIEFVRVTDKIFEIQQFILKLMDLGFAYKAEDGSTYFSIEKYQRAFGDYGQLVGEKFLEGKKVGARVAVDEYEKDNLSDFALWKAHDLETDGEIYWPSKTLGNGRPGWHIECSVINQVAFEGKTTHIHTGGVDLIFPHHTNEIAQSQPLYHPFVNHWLHNEHLLVDGQKMGKRFKNIYTIKDLKEKGFSGQDLRYFLMSSRFSIQQNFTWEGLLAARQARTKLLSLPEKGATPAEFFKSLDDNLNLPQALSTAWSAGLLNSEMNSVLGFQKDSEEELPEAIKKMLEQRLKAKQEKNFGLSDELRKQIEALGFELMDTPEGQKVKKKIII